MFDKTGTLTLGEPRVTRVESFDEGVDGNEVLALAAAAEQRLTHPAAQAIVQAAAEQGLPIPERDDGHFAVGLGARALVDGQSVLVGSLRYLQQQGISVPEHARAFANRSGEEGTSIVFVACAVARRLGIGRIEAEVFPEQKADVVRRLQAEGHRVGVVGDGINDSPALAYADVSMSLKAASDVARETADIVLHGDLHGLRDAIDLSRDSLKLIRQNLMIVAVPNGIGILLASLGLLGPVAATAINNGSNVAAALNGLRPLVRRPAPATG